MLITVNVKRMAHLLFDVWQKCLFNFVKIKKMRKFIKKPIIHIRLFRLVFYSHRYNFFKLKIQKDYGILAEFERSLSADKVCISVLIMNN
jgi:hypothetical protein